MSPKKVNQYHVPDKEENFLGFKTVNNFLWTFNDQVEVKILAIGSLKQKLELQN